MKFIAIVFLISGFALNLFAQNVLTNNQILLGLTCKVGLGSIGLSKIDEIQINIFKANISTQMPSYPMGEVTLTLSGQKQKVSLPKVSVGTISSQPPFSQFSVVGYMLLWNDKSKSELNLVCQDNKTCTGSANFQGYPVKVITCNTNISRNVR